MNEDVIQGIRQAGGLDVGATDEPVEESVSDRAAFYALQEKVLQFLVDRGIHFKSACKMEGELLISEVEVFNDAPNVTGIRYSPRVY